MYRSKIVSIAIFGIIGLIILFFITTLYSDTLDDIRKKLSVEKGQQGQIAQKDGNIGFNQIVGKYYIVQVKDLSTQEAEGILRYVDRMMEEFLKLYEYPFGTRKCYVVVYGLEKDYMRVAKQEKMDKARAFSYTRGISEYVITYYGDDIYPVLSHETFHILAENIFKNDIPFWFNEGMSSYYETCMFNGDKFESNRLNKKRLAVAKSSLQSEQLPKIKDLVRMSYDEFYSGNALVNYAVSWSLVYYLKNKDEAAYKNFVHDISFGKSFVTSIRQNYGFEQKELEENLKKYISEL
jgi:hypothetical protein